MRSRILIAVLLCSSAPAFAVQSIQINGAFSISGTRETCSYSSSGVCLSKELAGSYTFSFNIDSADAGGDWSAFGEGWYRAPISFGSMPFYMTLTDKAFSIYPDGVVEGYGSTGGLSLAFDAIDFANAAPGILASRGTGGMDYTLYGGCRGGLCDPWQDLYLFGSLTKLTITGFDGAPPPPARDVGFSVSAVPEPATWAAMIAGFGLVGAAMRRRNGAMASFA